MTPTARGRDLRAALDTRAEESAAWRPEPGETLVGVVERYDRRTARYGEADVALVRDEATGDLRAVWLVYATLRDLFDRERPKPGERIGVRRLDDGHGPRGAYRRFALVTDRDERSPEPAPPKAAGVANPFD
jgi:hypothetical protein